MEKVTCTIIFGNEHVDAHGQRQVINVLVSQELDTQSWKDPIQQLTQPPTPTLHKPALWSMLEQSRSLWLFLHLVQTCHHPVLCK